MTTPHAHPCLQSLAILAIGLILALSQPATATVQYAFADSSDNTTDTFTATPGETVEVRLFVIESTGSSVLQDELIASLGGQIQVADDSVADVLSTVDIDANPNFDPFLTVVELNPLRASGSIGFLGTPFSPGTLNAGTPDEVRGGLIASFTFTALSQGQTQLTAADFDTQSDDSLTGDGTVLDSDLQQENIAATFNVVPVPAAPLMGLALFAAVGTRAIRRRR